MFPLYSHPQGSTGSSIFWCQMKANIFLIIIPKFQLRIHYTLADIAENVPISGTLILIFFLCIFITASSQVSHSYILIFAPGEKIRSNLEVKLYKMCLRGQGWSVKSENTHVKMGTSPLTISIGSLLGKTLTPPPPPTQTTTTFLCMLIN